jgi:hypothetical protein
MYGYVRLCTVMYVEHRWPQGRQVWSGPAKLARAIGGPAKLAAAKSEERRAKSEERRAKSEERRAKSEERRAKSDERRVKSEEPRAERPEPGRSMVDGSAGPSMGAGPQQCQQGLSQGWRGWS